MSRRSRQRSTRSTPSFVRCRSRSKTREIASECWCPRKSAKSWSPPWRKNGTLWWDSTKRSPTTQTWIPLAKSPARRSSRLKWTRSKPTLRNSPKTSSSSTPQLPPHTTERDGQSMRPREDLARLTEWLTRKPVHQRFDFRFKQAHKHAPTFWAGLKKKKMTTKLKRGQGHSRDSSCRRKSLPVELPAH